MISYGLVLVLILLYAIYKYLTRHWHHWKKKNVPYLKPELLFGNIRDAIFLRVGMARLFQRFYDSSDSPVLGCFVLDEPCLLIRDPQLINTITTTDFQYFTDRTPINNKRDDPIGSYILFAMKNPQWKEMRNKVRPIFTTGKLKNMSLLIEECGADLIAHLKTEYVKSPIFNVKEVCICYTVDAITSCCFGVKAHSFQENAKFKQVAKKFFDWNDLWLSLQMRCYFIAPTLVRIFHMKLLHAQSVSFLKQSLLDIMYHRSKTNTSRNDLIDILLHLKNNDSTFTEADILVSVALNFFVAGYETTSAVLSFGLYELAKNPMVQEKLYAELAEISELNFDKIKELSYLDLVVKETLRKYPSLPFLDRNCNTTYKIPDTDITIEKGTKVFISLLGLHYDPKYFPEPETFDPDRFLAKDTSGTFLPFGNGPRFCIGDRFGVMMIKIALANIIKLYGLETTVETPTTIRFDPRGLLLSSFDKLNLRFIKRY